MRTASAWLLAAGLFLFTGTSPGVAIGQVLDPIQYSLSPDARFEYGCFGPCACPVVFSGPMSGTFTFYRTSVDPLFVHYALLDINWSYSMADPATSAVHQAHVTGHGTWDYGGEVALTQHLTLDLSTDGGPEQHFDSGVVAPGAAFPRIAADAFLKLDSCRDSVFHVVAGPPGTAGSAPQPDAGLLRRASPDPALGPVEIRFAPPAATEARVDVLDPQGRVVAVLFEGGTGGGEYRLRWDGHDAHGADAGSGVFWVRARVDGRSERLRIVRLR